MSSVSSEPETIFVANGTDFGGEVVRILGLQGPLINSLTLKYECNLPVTVTVEQLVTQRQAEQIEAALRTHIQQFDLVPKQSAPDSAAAAVAGGV